MREIPFPAFTLCTPLFIRSSIIKNIRDDYTFSSEEQIDYYIANNLRLSPISADKFRNRKYDINEMVHYLNISSLEVNELFRECSLHLEVFPCEKMFRKVLTDVGFCYTFNMEGLGTNFSELSDDFNFYKYDTKKFWSIDRGFFDTSDELTPPVRAAKKTLVMFSLHMNNSDAENYHLSKSYSWSLHLPNEMLTPFHKMHSLSFMQVCSFNF